MFTISDAWKTVYEGAYVGVLVMRGVTNPAEHTALEQVKKDLEAELRDRWSAQPRSELDAYPVLKAYAAYYKHFKKTYHVQLQIESIVYKNRSIPSVAALVEAMFMAEVKNMLLTAGHDLDSLQLPLQLGVAQGSETYILLRGEPQIPKAGDMMISDGQGIISSIIYGPDQRTQIQATTQNVLFTVYAPQGIPEQTVREHFQDIAQYVRLIAPGAQVEMLQVFGTA